MLRNVIPFAILLLAFCAVRAEAIQANADDVVAEDQPVELESVAERAGGETPRTPIDVGCPRWLRQSAAMIVGVRRWIIYTSEFFEFDKDRQPKWLKPTDRKPTDLEVSFMVAAAKAGEQATTGGKEETANNELARRLIEAVQGNNQVARRHAATDLAILLMKRNGVWRGDPSGLEWKLLSPAAMRREIEIVGATDQSLDLSLVNASAHCMARLPSGWWKALPVNKADRLESNVIQLLKNTKDPAVKVILLCGLASSKTESARDTVVAATAEQVLGVRHSAICFVERCVRRAFGPSGNIHAGSPTGDVDAAANKIRSLYAQKKTFSVIEEKGSAWGQVQKGLQVKAVAPAEIEQGMPQAVNLLLRCDPSKLDPGVKRLNTFLRDAFLELKLTNRRTGKTLVVKPYDPTHGMLVLDAGKDAVPLDGSSLKPWRVSFPLARLYDELWPGRYACRVQYSFPKTPTRFWERSEQEWRKASFWNGTVVSGQFDLKLKPETPKTITLLLPKRLGVVKKLVQLRMDDDEKSAVPVIRFRSRDAEKVTLPVRNGHFVMAQYSRDGKFYRLSGPPKPGNVNAIDTWYAYQGGDKKTSYTIEVFETRAPGGHEWFPNRESGGYKVLWKKTFVVSVLENEFRELPATTSGFLGPDLVAELVSRDISNEARDAVVEQLSQGDVANTGPRILKLLGEYRSPIEPGIGSKPWMHDSHSFHAKVWYASHAIWDALFRGEADPAKVKLLLNLLENHEDPYLRYVVLGTMRSQWTDEAEKPVFNLFQNPQVPASTREDALERLLQHCGERYVPHAIDFAGSAAPEEKAARFQGVFNIGNEFFSYSQKNQDQILSLGFSILEDEAKPGTSQGYGIATRLGFFLKIPNGFKPDRRARQYQGRNGLSEKFFSDTVQNALEWRRENMKPTKAS